MSARSNHRSHRSHRSIRVAYRSALVLAAVICATVIGIFVVDPLVKPGDANATTLPSFYGAAGRHGSAPMRTAFVESETWAADDSAKGARPDAAH